MQTVDVADVPTHQAPIPGGPAVRPLFGADSGVPAAVLHVTLPVGGGMPEHDHGPSHVVLMPQQGQVRLHHDGNDRELRPGTATHIDVGERVSLTNIGTDVAELLVMAAPPDFAATVSAWPTST